jgi:hypothetical protein
MFGSISNYENKFFLREEQIPGIESIDISYSNSPVTTKALGVNGGITTIGATTQQKISITRNLINDDPFLLYMDSDNMRGGIEYGGKSYRFNSGYLDEYMINCAVGSIPKVTTNITVYDEMQTDQSFQPSSYVREKLIPNQGSISITCDNSTTNRVIGFDYAIKRTRKPMYTIGSRLPSEIITFPTLEYTASVQIDVDDAFLQSGLSFLNNRENKSIVFTIKANNGSDIQSLTIPNASLIAESLSSSADGGVKLTLNYIGHVGDENPVINLEFAKNQTIIPRVGPTPTFIRASNATYFGPSEIQVNYNYLGYEYNATCKQDYQIINGRYQWLESITVFTYGASGAWQLFHNGNLVATSAVTAEWRPDRADWSGTNIVVSINDTFGIVDAAPNEPRFEYDPITLECLGLLMEYSSTNRIFPSDTLTTQFRSTNRTLHTLSFYGTGTVTLSGTHSAIITGTNETVRITYTFLPTNGNLTLTVEGSVKFAQLERESSASSYIKTSTVSATRSTDEFFYNGTDFISFYNNLAGTFVAESIVNGLSRVVGGFYYGGLAMALGSEQDGILIFTRNAPEESLLCVINIDERELNFYDSFFNNINAGDFRKFAFAFKAGKDFIGNEGNAVMCLNGVLGIEDNIVKVPGQFAIGSFPNEINLFQYQNSIIRSFSYYRNRLSNEKLQKLTLI